MVCLLFELFSDGFPRPTEQHADVDLSQSRLLCYLFVSQSFHVAERDDLPLLFGQLADELSYHLLALLPFHVGFGSGEVGKLQIVCGMCRRFEMLSSLPVDEQVVNDSGAVGFHVFVCECVVSKFPEFGKRILYDILCILTMTGQSQGCQEHPSVAGQIA